MRATTPDHKGSWLDKWHIAPSHSTSYDFLDGIRGIAILMVVACHLIYVNPSASAGVRFVFGIFNAGAYGVTVFFALSGFLISLPFWKQKANGTTSDTWRYAKRRFWKIAPPLALSILLLTPCYIYLHGQSSEYLQTALRWFTGQAFFIPVSGRLNPVMWSLIVEVHFYILLPLLFICLFKVRYQTAIWALTLSFLLVPQLAKWIYADYGMGFSLHPLIQVCPPTKLDAFAAGILVAGLHQSGKLSPVLARFAPLGLFGIIATMCFISWATTYQPQHNHLSSEITNLLIIAFSCLLLTFVAKPSSAGKWFLDHPILRWFGIISYEWYLLHQAAFLFLWQLIGDANGDPMIYLVRVIVPAIVSLIGAALIYRYFSLPILVATRGAASSEDKPGNLPPRRADPGTPAA